MIVPIFLRFLILTNNLNGVSFEPKTDGLYATYKVGADSVSKKLGNDCLMVKTIFNTTMSNGSYDFTVEIPQNMRIGFSIADYDICGNMSFSQWNSYQTSVIFTLKDYNPSTGILTYTATHKGNAMIYSGSHMYIMIYHKNNCI